MYKRQDDRYTKKDKKIRKNNKEGYIKHAYSVL